MGPWFTFQCPRVASSISSQAPSFDAQIFWPSPCWQRPYHRFFEKLLKGNLQLSQHLFFQCGLAPSGGFLERYAYSVTDVGVGKRVTTKPCFFEYRCARSQSMCYHVTPLCVAFLAGLWLPLVARSCRLTERSLFSSFPLADGPS